MEQFKKILKNLGEQTGRHAVNDGFQSGELRRIILSKIKSLQIGKHPQNQISPFMQLNDVEQLKLEYLQAGQQTGREAAIRHMSALLRPDAAPYLKDLILAGAEAIGREIGRGYASTIYPELRRLRVEGLDLKPLEEPKREKNLNYKFTVRNYGDYVEALPVTPTRDFPHSEIFYDDDRERYIEEFVFARVEDADEAFAAWERFEKDRKFTPPVKYGIVITSDAESRKTVGAVVHMDVFKKNSILSAADGSTSEILVFDTVIEAEYARVAKLKENQKNAVPNASTPAEKAIPNLAPKHGREKEREHKMEKAHASPASPAGKKKNLSIAK